MTKQAEDLGYQQADEKNKIVRWRLLVPLVGRVFFLPPWATLALAHLGCVVLLMALAFLSQRLAPTASLPAVVGFLLTAGATAPFFTSMGWLGYYDSLLAISLLVVAFAESRLAVILACLLGPWVDERFVLGVPLALTIRSLLMPRLSALEWLRREGLWPLAIVSIYSAFRLSLSGLSASHSVSQYLETFIFGQSTSGLQRLIGSWWGLRLGWLLVAVGICPFFIPKFRLSRTAGAMLLLVFLGTSLLALYSAADLSRSTVLILPLVVFGWVAAFRFMPVSRFGVFSVAMGVSSLALPAFHVVGNVSLQVDSIFRPSLPLRTAMNNLGVIYSDGDGVPRDTFNAVRWFRRAAERGVPEAQFNLGRRLLNGEGVPKDSSEAALWIRKAAELGFAPAQNALGSHHLAGDIVARDASEAAKWFRKAAEAGFAPAQFNLGVRYLEGDGVPKNEVEAAKWFLSASRGGVALAQFNLGLMYSEGVGVVKDSAESAKWLTRAADQGLAPAQNSLGLKYLAGDGVEKDSERAVAWLSRAAVGGFAPSQFNLGVAYFDGRGVGRDIVQAYAWTALAESAGIEGAEEALALIETQMTPREKADSARAAKDLAAKLPRAGK